MAKKTFYLTLLSISIIAAVIGFGFSAYNYYVFDKPFINSTTIGLISAFIMSTAMIIIKLSQADNQARN